MRSTRDERLLQFFAGYFNQDWVLDGSWSDVIALYVRTNRREQVLQTIEDLRSWLNEGGARGRDLPDAFGCEYDPRPDGLSGAEWVEQVVVALLEKQQLTN